MYLLYNVPKSFSESERAWSLQTTRFWLKQMFFKGAIEKGNPNQLLFESTWILKTETTREARAGGIITVGSMLWQVSNPCFNGLVSMWPRRSGCASMKRRSRITNATFWSAQTAIREIEIIQNLKGHKLESRVTFCSARVVPVSPPTSLYHWKYQQVNIFRKTGADYTVQQAKNYRKRTFLALVNFGMLNTKMKLKT
jgi:hypothetical protein